MRDEGHTHAGSKHSRVGARVHDELMRGWLAHAHLPVNLPQPLHAVFQVCAALGANVDVVNVKDGPAAQRESKGVRACVRLACVRA